MDCHIWNGPKNEHGYGRLNQNNHREYVHRHAYRTYHNLSEEDIAGIVIRHTCDNPACANPLHLIGGTQADNMEDMRVKRRAAQKEGHPNAKLSMEVVAEIRSRFTPRCRKNGGAALAREFGVTQPLVSMIANNKLWSDYERNSYNC
jgi:hypothetical protein